ncbi:hypothetical protein Lfu02_16830 [Longispora fulva]|nr:hypothetical protein Lfu02_16830 [Longispora fulva]
MFGENREQHPAEHHEIALREIDDPGDLVDERDTESYHRVGGSGRESNKGVIKKLCHLSHREKDHQTSAILSAHLPASQGNAQIAPSSPVLHSLTVGKRTRCAIDRANDDGE